MKKITLYTGFIVLLSCLLFSCSSGKKAAAINPELEEAIASDNWLFTANQANPQLGNNRFLDAGYDVKCSKGKLQSYLPYFGRSFSGAAYTNQSPLDFKTEAFSISKEKGKKNSWVLIIRPSAVPDVREYRLTVFSNGTASLDVQLDNRTPMSFGGQLQAGR